MYNHYKNLSNANLSPLRKYADLIHRDMKSDPKRINLASPLKNILQRKSTEANLGIKLSASQIKQYFCVY